MTAAEARASECPHPGGLPLTDRMLDLAMLAPGQTVLDVGCGDGATLARLVDDRRLRAVGLDASAARIAAARHARPDLEFVAGRAAGLPFADASFDAVLAECVLSTLDDPRRAVAEMGRILRPGGAALINDLYWRAAGDAGRAGGMPSLGTRDRVEDLLAGAGLRIVVWEDHTGVLARLLWDLAGAAASHCVAREIPATAGGPGRAGSPGAARTAEEPRQEGRRLGYFICVARPPGCAGKGVT